MKFREKARLNVHLKTHDQSYLCHLCGNNFQTKKLLNRHSLVVHNQKKKILCSQCNKAFRDNYGLKRHLIEGHKAINYSAIGKIISNDKKQSCPLCGALVKRLTRHLLYKHCVDSSLQPVYQMCKFQCSKCEKPMRDSFNLQRHENACGEKKSSELKCSYCKKEFTFQQNLTVHIAVMHKHPKKCEKCQITFETKHHFLQHLPCKYRCKCKETFSQLRRLLTHEKQCDVFKSKICDKDEFVLYKCFLCGLNGLPYNQVEVHTNNHDTEGTMCYECNKDVKNTREHILTQHHYVRKVKPMAIYVKDAWDDFPSSRAKDCDRCPSDETDANCFKDDCQVSECDKLDTGYEDESSETSVIDGTSSSSKLDKAAHSDVAQSDTACKYDIDVILAFELKEEVELNKRLDMVDLRIAKERQMAEIENQRLDEELTAQREYISLKEKRVELNDYRAEELNRMDPDEIVKIAQKFLDNITFRESSSAKTYRRRLFDGSNGDRQSLLYRQIWHPFNDKQHGRYLLLFYSPSINGINMYAYFFSVCS